MEMLKDFVEISIPAIVGCIIGSYVPYFYNHVTSSLRILQMVLYAILASAILFLLGFRFIKKRKLNNKARFELRE